MKKTLLTLLAALGLCVGQSAQAQVSFGIPLPFPFLVWTPSGYSGQRYYGNCGQGAIQDRTTIIPMSATTDIRGATTPTRTRPAIIAVTTTATATIGPTGGGATTMAIIGVGTTARDTITVEGN